MKKSKLKLFTTLCAVALAGSAAATIEGEAGFYRTDATTNGVDYLLIAPPDFYGDWCWYVDQRQSVHTNLRFAVKNAANIYAEHPFGTGLACRNAAESIHAYLRQAFTNGLKYVVLGGAWLDAQNLNNYTTYFVTGEEMSLSNCVPGIYGFPRENWRQIPADLFYGCLKMEKGQKYPWDANEDGVYIDKDNCQYNNTYPDVCVSRITLNPHSGYGDAFNQHELITNYVAKLARGEDRLFAGHYRYGMSVASTGSSKLRKSGDRMCYTELEFYDGMYNMFDPRHHDSLEDGEYSTRDRYVSQFSMWRPVRSVAGMMNYTWTGGQPTLAAAMDDYYAGDRDFGYVQAHGWAQGAAQFSAHRFATATGLTLFNGGSGPCETGYPDYYVWSGGKRVLQYNVGDAAVTNPKGGALASVNNSRWSWAGGGGGFAAMSYYMLNEMLIGFNQERLDVGHAWLKGVRNYWPAGRWGNTAGWVLTEQFLYGDPLVRLPEVPNVWWQGGETGVWDRVTANWTNSVDDVKTFDAAYNVYFDVQSNLTLDVAGEIAAMRLSLPVQQEDAMLTLAGTGSLRVMQSVDVAGTNATLAFDVAGGVGHKGIRFVTGPGNLVFEGENKFYVGGVTNANCIALRGGGVTLDVDAFAAGAFPIVFDGSGGGQRADRPTVPNELRSKNVGGLQRFGSLGMTNTYVKLATVDAFGNKAPMTHTLSDSTLEIAANVYYQRSGFPEGLNATFLVDGDSEATSSLGGLWTVKHTTTFALQPDTRLTLSAETSNAGGKIVITNVVANAAQTNVVEVKRASALAGHVTIGPGIRLVCDELPLHSVSSLTVGKGATIELPDDQNGYWQLVPVSSKFSCADDVAFVTASNPTNRLNGSPSPTGSFFREGALYRWTGTEGAWNVYFANRHPKILFGDLADASVATVDVATAVSPEFAFFSNLKTKYVFNAADGAASVLFPSVYFSGATEFNLPVYATEYVAISSATSVFTHVAAPYVQVSKGAGLALAGSHWTEFVLDAGSVLVAQPGEALDWNADTTLTFPDDGEVLVDVGALELTDTPQTLITGFGRIWTLAELKHLKLVQPNAEFRVVDGALCVVRGDNFKGPYVIEASKEGAHEHAIDADVFADSVIGRVATNASVVVRSDASAKIVSPTIDLSDALGTITFEVATGEAEIIASTNETSVCRLLCEGTGLLRLSGGELYLRHSANYTLAAGSQGTLRIVAPQAYERFRATKVADGFQYSGLTVLVEDANGHTVSGFTFSVSDGALWCTPPALEAIVPPGTNDISRLAWRDVIGNVVSNVDWTSNAGFKLIGTPTSGVVIAKSGFASIWNRLTVTNSVTLYGNDTLTPTQIPGGSGTLALAGAFTIKANVNKYPTLLSGSRLKLLDASTLEISHGGANFDATAQNWSGITGTGRIRFTDAKSSWLAIPGGLFAATLSVESASDIVLSQNINDRNPFAVANLSGEGSFRTDWGNGNWRPITVRQTGVSAFSGVLTAKAGSRDSCLIVSSDASAPTIDKALILSGQAVADHQLTIKPTGCVILTGSWKGPIYVEGILVITNACATNGVSVKVQGTGKIVTIAPEDMPVITQPSKYVAPSYPEDPVVPDEPVVDTRVRWVTANVAAVEGSTALPWSRLDWRDERGESVTVDWADVTNATLTASDACRVIYDAEQMSGVVRLAGDVTLEIHDALPFSLDADSVGAVDFRLSPEPTSTCDLLAVAPGDGAPANVVVTLHNRYGRDIATAGEVNFDASRRMYYLNVQNVSKPTYSNTFDSQYDDTLSSSLWFSGSGALTRSAYPQYFVESRSGYALVSTCKSSFGAMHSHNGNPTVDMDNVKTWTLHFVARLPTNNGGIVFAFGNKDSGNGVAFARASENVAGVYAWKNAGTPTLVASANVALGSSQFHAYAITYDGATLRFYADGVLADEAALNDKYPTRGFYQWFKMYGQNGWMSDGATSVIDDFRLYVGTCLTPTSVKVIANQFAPWPEQPTAKVDVPDLAWSNLYWSAECPADETLTLEAAGGNLLFDRAITVTNALAITGGTIPLKLVDDGELIVTRGLAAATTLAIDASGLDGAQFADQATDTKPCERYLVRGSYTGPVTITALPTLPTGYRLAVDTAQQTGVRLIVYKERDDIDAPWYSITFDGNINTKVSGGANLVPLKNEGDYTTYVASRGGQAQTGGTPYSSSNMAQAPVGWTIHAVAKMPREAKGILFGYGKLKERGVGLATVDADTVSLSWWNSSGRQAILEADVPYAATQYHAYTIVSTGMGVSFYIDGVLKGEKDVVVAPTTPVVQFGSVYGGIVSGFTRNTSYAIDDWRLYDGILSTNAIRRLATQFAPWPVFCAAELSQPDTAWSDLVWTGTRDANTAYYLENKGGSLAIANICELENALLATGDVLTLKLSGEGLLKSSASLDFSTGWTIDCAGIDGTNLATRAVAGAPYSRWLVRGAYSGGNPTITHLPAVPKHYKIAVEYLAAHGVRLVVTAASSVRQGAISVSIGNDDFSNLTGELGLYPDAATNWLAYANWSTTMKAVGQIAVAGLAMKDGKVDPTGLNKDGLAPYFRHTSFDGNGGEYDGQECGYALSNLTAFASAYRVLVYMNSNQAEGGWGPVTIGGRNYSGLWQNNETACVTLSDTLFDNWGKLMSTPVAREGVNVVVSDVLTNDAIQLVGHRNYATKNNLRARGQIAAFQIVKVGAIPEVIAVDYVAYVTNTTAWSQGKGEGLVVASDAWVNDPSSTITLNAMAAKATLDFDTAVTAETLRVVSEAGHDLTLKVGEAPFAIAGYDFSQAKGAVTFRYPDPGQNVNAMNLMAGVGTSYGAATIRGDLQGADYAKRKLVVEEGDDITIESTSQYGCADLSVEVNGGHLTYASKLTWFRYDTSYRQTGGLVTFNATLGTPENRTTVIPGYTGGGTFTMNISGGTTDVSRTAFYFDQPTAINLSGTGVLKVMGAMGNTANAHTVMIADQAVLELGATGWNAQSQPITLKGGELRGDATSSVACALNVTGNACITAASGTTLTIKGNVTVSAGTLKIGPNVKIEGTVTTKDAGRVRYTQPTVFSFD